MSSLPDDQHMARVSIPEDQWLEFRALAIRKKRSVAAYLGHLVQKEIGRATRVEGRRSSRQKLSAGGESPLDDFDREEEDQEHDEMKQTSGQGAQELLIGHHQIEQKTDPSSEEREQRVPDEWPTSRPALFSGHGSSVAGRKGPEEVDETWIPPWEE